MKNLTAQAISGFIWSSIDRFGQLGFSFVVQIILARLLLPEQFGLVAMVIVFVTIGKAITDSGFSQALIQKKSIDLEDGTTVFAFNLGVAFLIWLLLSALSPLIAGFFEEPELRALLPFLSSSIFFSAFGQVHLAFLTRELAFQKSVRASLPATLIAGAISIGLAICGWGVWALAANTILQSAFFSLFLWFVSPWRPTPAFSTSSLRSMFSFGSRLAAAGILRTLMRNIFVLVIGKGFSATEVGYYHKAVNFQNLGAESFSSVISRVTFPLYSRIQNDRDRLRRAFLQSLSLLALFFFPVMALLAGVAGPLIHTLIGEKWEPFFPSMLPASTS
mgnify:FL=1